MRGNNRKSIEKCRKRLPQFTTMNVIDGQAGLVIYSSLIFYSLTIDNILNIIVLLILAGVSIATLTGDNGILTRASKAQDEQADATVKEAISLAWNEYQIEINNATGEIVENETKIASTTQVRIQGQEQEYLATSSMSFLDFLEGKGYIDENGIVDVKTLTGETLSKGNGTDNKDVYILIEDKDMYVLKYYDSEGIPATEDLWSVNKVNNIVDIKTITIKNDEGYPEITEVTIQYEEGMTWKDFINSEYNIDNVLIENEFGYVLLSEFPEAMVSSDSPTDEYGRNETIDDVIDSSRNFFFVILQ